MGSVVSHLEAEWNVWLPSSITVAGAVVLALIVHFLIFLALKRGAEKTGGVFDASLVAQARRPASILFSLVAVLIVLPATALQAAVLDGMRHVVGLGIIAVSAWLAVSLTAVLDRYVSMRFKVDVSDNLLARRIHTRTRMLRRIIVIGILTVAVSTALMTFPGIRHVGISLFASAGVVGLVAGIAARPILSNIIAGLQIALSDVIRIDDVVVLEGELGWIEEIGTTNVVVRLWDLRRLIVPLVYFIERPFQNWTHKTADILGTVFLYTDYSIPVDAVRQEFHRLLQASGMWDGKVWGLQVTNATEHSMELRAVMSAADAATAWDLRCHVREKLLAFLNERYPESLPRIRAEMRQDSR